MTGYLRKKNVMIFELRYFWDFYSVTVGDVEEDFEEIDPLEELDAEYLRIVKNLDCFVPVKEKGGVKGYIRFQQHSMVRLIKLIEARLDLIPSIPDQKTTVLTKLLGLTEQLVDHLLNYHTRYFDFDEELSKGRAEKFLEVNLDLKTHFQTLLYDCGVQTHLADDPFNSPNKKQITFGEMVYQGELLIFLKEKATVIKEEPMLYIELLRAGYNRPDFLNHYLKDIGRQISEGNSIAEQYRKVISIRKEVDQLLPTGNPILDRPSWKIRARIKKFLAAELKFLKLLDFITSELINTGILDANYKVSLSVKQLAFYIFLNVECGIITEQKAKKVHEYVISHVATSEKQGISEKSFKNAYYVHAPEDIKKIIEKLGRMLAIARNHF